MKRILAVLLLLVGVVVGGFFLLPSGRAPAKATGAMKGRVRFADGSAPERFRLEGEALGEREFTGGDFSLAELPPGLYSFEIFGPTFVHREIEGVVIFAGAESDL